ncbi:hypothetical protein [Parasphingorhabdus cellanae]|uniref:Lipoprotein n=1 Tax=Parasphingorhabdus cellanae TaxID=2806553 RepID=A0ABX7SZ38_9SPHN|nr:hypothetical protein [Parasphingorhabdus cellanae]QTD54541.1 hypothetical protein J4G78_09585 [Parasphingorhabdus cellanae]
MERQYARWSMMSRLNRRFGSLMAPATCGLILAGLTACTEEPSADTTTANIQGANTQSDSAALTASTAEPDGAEPDGIVTTPESLETDLNSALPKGSTAEQVSAYLADRNIEHSGAQDQSNMAHMGANPDEKLMTAIMRDVKTSALAKQSIAMKFYFDDANKLVRTTVEEVNTGL